MGGELKIAARQHAAWVFFPLSGPYPFLSLAGYGPRSFKRKASGIVDMAEFSKRWLKIKDAAEYSSIDWHHLRHLVLKENAIKGFIDPDSIRGNLIIDRISV